MTYKMIKLNEVCDLQNGYAFRSKDYVESSGTLLCRMSNIRPEGYFDINYNPRYLPDEYANDYQNFLLKDGDLVIAMTDMASEPKILGVPIIVETRGNNVLLNQRVGKLIITRPELINKNYLMYALTDYRVKSY